MLPLGSQPQTDTRSVVAARIFTALYLVALTMALGFLLNVVMANAPGMGGALLSLVLMVAWLYFAVLIVERQVLGVVAAEQAARVTTALASLGLPTEGDDLDEEQSTAPDAQRLMVFDELRDLAARDGR